VEETSVGEKLASLDDERIALVQHDVPGDDHFSLPPAA